MNFRVEACANAKNPTLALQWIKEIEAAKSLLRKVGTKKPLQSISLPCFFSKSKEKKSRRQISLMSMTNHAVGIGTCTQSMTIPRYFSSEMHLQKFPDQTEFRSWIVNFRADVYAKAKNLALVLQKIEATR